MGVVDKFVLSLLVLLIYLVHYREMYVFSFCDTRFVYLGITVSSPVPLTLLINHICGSVFINICKSDLHVGCGQSASSFLCFSVA